MNQPIGIKIPKPGEKKEVPLPKKIETKEKESTKILPPPPPPTQPQITSLIDLDDTTKPPPEVKPKITSKADLTCTILSFCSE